MLQFIPEILLYLAAVTAYVSVGFAALCYCERYPLALDLVVGQSNTAMIVAWVMWPLTAIFTLVRWWSNRTLRVNSNDW